MPVALPPFSHTGSSRDQGSIRTQIDRVDRLGREGASKIARGGTGSDVAFPNHLFLHPVGCWHRDDLANRSCGCASAIAAPVDQLLLPHAPPPIARGFAGQLPERGREGGLRGIAKRCCDRHNRLVGVPQHVHGPLEPVLAQPGMR